MSSYVSRTNIAVVGSFYPEYVPGFKPWFDPNSSHGADKPEPDLKALDSDSANQSMEEQFRTACRAIGKALAEAGHTIVLYVPDWKSEANKPTVCDSVLEGVVAARNPLNISKHKVILLTPEENPDAEVKSQVAITLRDVPSHVQVTRKKRAVIRNYYPETFPSVCEADAIILICGENMTEMVASAAHFVAKIPVVTITSFKGAAKSMHHDIFCHEYDKYLAASPEAGQLALLEESWDAPKNVAANSDQANDESNQMVSANVRPEAIAERKNEKRAENIVKLTEELIRCTRQSRAAEEKRRKRLLASTERFVLCWAILFCLLIAPAATKSNPQSNGNESVQSTPTPTTTPNSASTPVGTLLTRAPTSDSTPAASQNDQGKTEKPTQSWHARVVAFLDSIHEMVQQYFPWLPAFILNLGLWALLFLAAMLGLQLKTSVSYEAGEILDLGAWPMQVSKVTALVLSIGLALVYYIGGWSFAGAVEFPNSPEAISAAAVVMSILGLAGGFLLPAEELRTRLRQFISPSSENPAP